MSYDPMRGFDAWLTTDRSLDREDAEWDAYVEWMDEQGHIVTDDSDPTKDEDWQAHCKEVNRLIDESWASYMEAEADGPDA